MKKIILTTFIFATFLLIFLVSYDPIQAENNVVNDFEGLKAETFMYNVFLPLVRKDQEENNTVIDFEGLAEGDIPDILRNGAGISGDVIDGDVSVFGSNPDFPDTNTAMIFDATCVEGCSGGDDDLHFPELGNGLIISEDLDSSDPDDADGPGVSKGFRCC